MRSVRARLALLLLLCFTRVLLPDAWILALHQHEHTLEESAQATRVEKSQASALLTIQHQHCQVDHFYHIPFQVPAPIALPTVALCGRTEAVGGIVADAHCNMQVARLRGPPSQV